jgi:hypothetical protein
MTLYLIKLLISAAIIVAVSEISKRTGFWGGVLASLPLVSFLSMIWLYVETKDVEKIASLSTSIFWFVLPSLILFVLLPILLRRGVNFPASLTISTAAMFGGYLVMSALLARFGIRL